MKSSLHKQEKKSKPLDLTEEILKEKYRDFIGMFLEKTTYFVIYAIKDLNEIRTIAAKEEQVKIMNSSTKIISSNSKINKITLNQSVQRICKALDLYQKLMCCEIPILDSLITHSKKKNENLKSLKTNLSDLGITINTKIQQEWGGSNWEIHLCADKNNNEYIYCEEVGKYKMKFLFNEAINFTITK